MYYFRDQQALEVDFVVPRGDRALALIEAKASRTVVPAMAAALARLRAAASRYEVDATLIYQGAAHGEETRAVYPGVVAAPVAQLRAVLEKAPRPARRT